MIERVGKQFPTLFICVRERVRPAPLEPKDGLVVGPAAASLRLSSALPRYRRARSLTFQALQIGATSLAPQVPLLAVGLGSHWTVKSIEKVDENTFWMYNECVDRIWMTMYLGREG